MGSEADVTTPLAVLLGALVFFLVLGPIITMLAWNAVMPYILALPSIGFWKAFALNILVQVFKGASANATATLRR